MKTGAGRLAEGIRAIRNSYLQAVSALEAGKRKHPSRWYYEFSEYCLAYMLYHCIGDLPRKHLCRKDSCRCGNMTGRIKPVIC